MTARLPAGTEAARPFLPTRDFAVSRDFYLALGFEMLLDGEVAIFRVGGSGQGFILQRHYQQAWAENTMLQLMVDDLDVWWAHLLALDLPRQFEVQPPKPPALQPWGLRVVYLYDPAGVLWHVSQRRPEVTWD